jgi:hypothetical protein
MPLWGCHGAPNAPGVPSFGELRRLFSATGKRVKMVKTISLGVTVQQLRFGHATSDGFSGNALVVILFLFFGFTGEADRFMIIDR